METIKQKQIEPLINKSKLGKGKILLGSAGALAFLAVSAGAVFAVSTKTTKQTDVLNRVAEIVGVDKTKLAEATKQATKEQVDKELADGKITQTQADEMKKMIDSGEMLGFGGGPGPRMMKGEIKGGIMHQGMDEVATFLGLSKEDLAKKHRDEEQSLLEIAKAQGKSEGELKAFLVDSFNKQSTKAVTDGDITQVQADKMKEDQGNRIDEMINQKGAPKGGHFGMRKKLGE
jgi:hypothetical protein